jgi:hypothetical protein
VGVKAPNRWGLVFGGLFGRFFLQEKAKPASLRRRVFWFFLVFEGLGIEEEMVDKEQSSRRQGHEGKALEAFPSSRLDVVEAVMSQGGISQVRVGNRTKRGNRRYIGVVDHCVCGMVIFVVIFCGYFLLWAEQSGRCVGWARGDTPSPPPRFLG